MGISQTMQIGASGLNAFSEATSVTSDNIANAGSTAYKANQVRFADMVAGYLSTMSPDLESAGVGTAIEGIHTDFSQGNFVSTSNWSSLAIDGKGFFKVQALDSDGNPTGPMYYTRDGNFHMDSQGRLVNDVGYAVLDTGGSVITVDDPSEPEYTDYKIDKSGRIWGTPVDGGDPEELGAQIGVSAFANEGALVREGYNLYSPSAESGEVVDGIAGEEQFGALKAFNIEGSNVDIAREMINLIVYQANYTANSKSVSSGNQMLDTTFNMVR